MPFANNFSQSVARLLICLILSFPGQKALILMKSGLSIISFVDRAFTVVSKKLQPYPRSSKFSPVFSSGSFQVLSSTLRSVIQFELIFVKSITSAFRFILLHVDV